MKMFNKSNIEGMDIEQYLLSKGAKIISKADGELKVHCLFGDCDVDSRGTEAHLYVNSQTGVYYCHKCGVKGNKVTLAQYFDDWERSGWLDAAKNNNNSATVSTQSKTSGKKGPINNMEDDFNATKMAEKMHLQLSAEAEEYLANRGLMPGTIKYAKIGEFKKNGKRWLSIPILRSSQEASFFKLRCWPGEEENGPKYINYPGGNEADLYGGYELLEGKYEEVLITEGEFDRLIAYQNGLPFPVSGTSGARTFKQDWLRYFVKVKKSI